MEFYLLLVVTVFVVAGLILSIVIIGKIRASSSVALSERLENYENRLDSYEKDLKDEFARNRKETSESNADSRKENRETLMDFQNSINNKFDILTKNTQESMTNNLTKFMDTLSQRLDSLTKTTQDTLASQQQAVQTSLKNIQDSNEKKLEEMRVTVDEKLQTTLEKRLTGSFEIVTKQLEVVQKGLGDLTKNTQESMTNNLTKFMDTLSQRLESLSKTTQDTLASQQQAVQTSLKNIQDSNEKKLEEMRVTVDEKLQTTLEKRLTGSFEIVTKQLEAVQKGLGEMQNLASDVGGLKRALTNVKTAGGMGEIQLEALLDQMLSPEQYVKNAHPNPSNEKKVVEFAVKIPSKTADDEHVLLPIDSKYPATVWDKLSLAYDNADKDEIDAQKRALVSDIKKMAKDIKEKYIEVPYTTDFGLMFLPFEGLFAEVMRVPGLFQKIQEEYKVTIAGPTTLGAFLNSLQMGFRTLAIQKETSKVWDLLGVVKTEFSKFGNALAATKKKLDEASNNIGKVEVRSRAIERKLKNIEALPSADSNSDTETLLENLTDEE